VADRKLNVEIEPDGNGNILDLDDELEEKETIIEFLTDYLIKADDGKIRSVCIFTENMDGTWGLSWTRTANSTTFAAKMMQWSLQKLGMVEQDELSEYVKKEEFE
jgi:hypothetical protein